jgi:hypothetical protein
VPFTLMPESSSRLPLLAHAWTAAIVVHFLLWAAKLLSGALFVKVWFMGPVKGQPLVLWSWFAGPLFVFTCLVHWWRGSLRSPWSYVVTAVLWLGLWMSLPRLEMWLAGETGLAALATAALFVLPLGLSAIMIRLVVDAAADAKARVA